MDSETFDGLGGEILGRLRGEEGSYAIQSLPTPVAEPEEVIVSAISNAGHIVGAASSATGALHALLWEPNGSGGYSVTDLGDVVGAALISEARDVNDRGEVGGGYRSSARGRLTGVQWRRNAQGTWGTQTFGDGMLEALTHDDELVQNRREAVVVHSWKSSRQGSGGAPTALSAAVAYGANDGGDVTGEIVLSRGERPQAFVTASEKTTVDVLLPGPRPSVATAVNAFRSVCGTAGDLAAAWLLSFDRFLQRWTWELMTLHNRGYKSGAATGINDLDEVVGIWSSATGEPVGFAIDLTTRKQLRQLLGFVPKLEAAGLDSLPPANHGFSEMRPADINNAGQIAGVAMEAGRLVPFVMWPMRSYSLVDCIGET